MKVILLTSDKRALEAQLTPAMHSAGVLMNEIEKEQEKLAEDLQRLEDIQQDTKRSKAKTERHSRTAHPLLSTISANSPGGDGLDLDGIEVQSTPKLQVR